MNELSDTDLDKQAVQTITMMKKFFAKHSLNWWVEAGTALAAWRDGKMMPWDHDIDVAIWYEDCPSERDWLNYFDDSTVEITFQKNLPYLDNLIQIRKKNPLDTAFIDVDVYLYKRHQGEALMRWLHNPTGRFSNLKRFLFLVVTQLVAPRSEKWQNRAKFLPIPIIKILFFAYLSFYMATSKCRYHRFPERFFDELQSVKLCGEWVKISRHADEYLEHRYGPHWRKPDPNFNQSGKWKQSLARPDLPLNHLPKPDMRV